MMLRKFNMIAAVVVLSTLAAFAQIDPKVDVCGRVTDVSGKPLEGVVVSDGYNVVATDAQGKYAFRRNPAAWFVFYSIPSGYEVPLRQGQPVFYKKLDDKAARYDFVLTPQRGGADKAFNIFFIGDPQSQNIHHVDRLRTEAIPDIKAYASRQKGRSYAITLGDIGYTEGGRNTNWLFPIIRNEMAADKAGMPFFQTVGNHDFEFATGGLDDNSPTISIRRNRMYESVFGPVDYSWNRGDVHFVSMNDVCFESIEKASKYKIDITDQQLEWLRKDLSYVPKDKMVVLTMHIPVFGKKNANCAEVVRMLGEYADALIVTGHTHTNYKSIHPNGVREYTVGALSGCWWWSRNCADGSPNGYLVCRFEGNHLKSHVYKATGFSDKMQMRIYRGDAVYGGSFEEFPLQYGHNTLLVNVWNWEQGSRLDVYENNRLIRTLTEPMPVSGEFVPTADGTKDWWAIGYNVGVVGRGHAKGSTRNNYCSKNYHMFRYDMADPSAKVRMVFTDASGRSFTETHVFETAEYDQYAAPPAYDESDVWNY